MSNGKSLAVPNELPDIGVEIIGGQTVFINLRTANLKIIWKSNVSLIYNTNISNKILDPWILILSGCLTNRRGCRVMEFD